MMDSGTETILDPEKEYEIVDGEPEEKEMGSSRRGGVGARLIVRLGGHVEANDLGAVYGPDTTFRIGGNKRIPDVAFLAASRIPSQGETESEWAIAPNLAVEIVSPNDLYEKVVTKIDEYLVGGVKQVWLISPEHQTVTVYTAPRVATILGESDELTGGDLVPGFRCLVRELFRQPPSTTPN